jgi:hypothetical protein
MKIKDGLFIVEDISEGFHYHLAAKDNWPFAICGEAFGAYQDVPEHWGDYKQLPEYCRFAVLWCPDCEKKGMK